MERKGGGDVPAKAQHGHPPSARRGQKASVMKAESKEKKWERGLQRQPRP